MQIRLKNCKRGGDVPEGIKAIRTWFSPDGRFVVAEIFYGEYFIAGEIIEGSPEQELITVDCRDERDAAGDESDFRSYSVEWDSMPDGFCKLRSLAMESFKLKYYRLYLDPELYKRKYEEKNGTPYEGNKKFHH